MRLIRKSIPLLQNVVLGYAQEDEMSFFILALHLNIKMLLTLSIRRVR